MKASELMTAQPCCCSPDDSMQTVAQMMLDNDCGCVPVVQDMKVIGVVTDRDIAVRGVAGAMGADTGVRQIMSDSPHCCGEDDDIEDVERTMSEHQVRRVPIVNSEGMCVGIVAQADLARAATSGSKVSDQEVASTVGRISQPDSAQS
ncbi:MAG: CBS domain-containing protein [Gemmatimonadaceae bacterium]